LTGGLLFERTELFKKSNRRRHLMGSDSINMAAIACIQCWFLNPPFVNLSKALRCFCLNGSIMCAILDCDKEKLNN